MQFIDSTIITTALPKMSTYFQVNSATISLLVSVYLITMAMFIPLSGWLGIRFGQKTIWSIAVALFTITSLGNAIAPNFITILVARIIQGIAASMMVPTSRLIVLQKTPSKLLLKAATYLIWPALIAPAIAPILGGFIVKYLTWNWIFIINIPIGIVALILGQWMVPQTKKHPEQKFDLIGFLEIALASSLILIGADVASHGKKMWGSAAIMVLIGMSLAILVAYHLTHTKNPLVSVKSFKFTSFRIFQTGGSFLWLTLGAIPYMLTIYLQVIFDFSPVKASFDVFFIFIGNVVAKLFANQLIRIIHYKRTIILSTSIILISTLLFAFLKPSTPSVLIMGLAFINGMGRSIALTAYNTISMSDVSYEDRASANTINSISQTMSQGLGVSIATVVVSIFSTRFNLTLSYELGFIFLAIMVLYPIIETALVDKNIGNKAL